MKQKKKALATLVACGLIGAMAIGGTFAYLTDEEQTINKFTVGKVEVDVKEPNWDPDKPTPTVPNEEIPKNPTITNTGDNSMYAFVKVDIPRAEVMVAADDGTRDVDGVKYQDLFMWGVTKDDTTTYVSNPDKGKIGAEAGVYDNWMLIDKGVTENGTHTSYVFAYQEPIAPNTDTPLTLFDKVKFVNVIEGSIDGEDLEMPVTVYAIQSDNIVDVPTTGEAIDKLTHIYNVYAKQNEGEAPRLVDENGNLVSAQPDE